MTSLELCQSVWLEVQFGWVLEWHAKVSIEGPWSLPLTTKVERVFIILIGFGTMLELEDCAFWMVPGGHTKVCTEGLQSLKDPGGESKKRFGE